MRAASLFPALSMLEQTSEKSRPDLLISGCSGVLFGPVLAGEQTKPVLAREQIKKSATSAATRSRRTAASHQWRDSTSDLECCQPGGRLFRQSPCTGAAPLRPLFSLRLYRRALSRHLSVLVGARYNLS